MVRFGGGQKDCREKHAKTCDGGKPAIPKTKRQDDKCGARESQKNTERHPGLSVAAYVENLGNQQNGGKHGADDDVAQARGGTSVMRCRSGWGRAHLALLPYLIYLVRVRGAAQGFNESISRMRAKARRTWGMVIDPPTIKATFKASMTSSRFQPSSPQRTR